MTYTNTFYHCEPRLDVCAPGEHAGRYDLVVCSEVFEHVPPPVEPGFAGLFELLRPGGLLVFSVPYTADGETIEHFPDLHEYEILERDGGHVLRNTARDGHVQEHTGLVFHGGPGETLELRAFALPDVLARLRARRVRRRARAPRATLRARRVVAGLGRLAGHRPPPRLTLAAHQTGLTPLVRRGVSAQLFAEAISVSGAGAASPSESASTLESRSSTTISFAPRTLRSCLAVSTRSSAISSTTAELPGVHRLAERLELVVLEAGVAQLRGQRTDAAAREDADRAAEDPDHAADERAAAGAPVLRLDELHLTVLADDQHGGVPDPVGKGAADGAGASRPALRGGKARSQDLAVGVSHARLLRSVSGTQPSPAR